MYKPSVIRPKDHNAWLSMRGKGVGASEIGALLMLSKFDTPYTVWRRKVGLDGPTPENIAMLMGHLLEDAVAQRFAIETGFRIVKASAADIIYYDPDKAYMRVTPDRILKTDEGKALLECKTTARKVDENNIPMSWLCQVQYQMRVTGIHTCYLAWLVSGRDFGYTRIDFDQEMSDYIEKRVTDFWLYNVLGNVEPESVNVGDVELKTPNSVPDKSVEADEDAVKDLKLLARLMKIQKDTEERIGEVKSRIQVYMGDSENLMGSGEILCTWKSGKARKSFDSDTFSRDYPELYAKYLKDGKASRRFMPRVADDD